MKKHFLLVSVLFCLHFVFISCSKSDDSGAGENSVDTEITVTTTPPTDLTATYALSGGTYTNPDNENITEVGLVYSESSNPIIDDHILTKDEVFSGYQSQIKCLAPETTYYLRAYVKIPAGVVYGNELSITTTPHVVYQGNVRIRTAADINPYLEGGYTKISDGLYIDTDEGSPLDLINFYKLTEIGGDFKTGVYDELMPTNFAGLECLQSVGGEFRPNSSMPNLKGLENLKRVGSFRVTGIRSFIGLEGLERVEGDFRYENDYFSNTPPDFTGLNNLEYIGGRLKVFRTGLITFDGLESLTTLNGIIDIDDNESLTSINGLQGLTSLNSPVIENNSSLQSFEGLHNVEVINGRAFFYQNDLIRSFNRLENLTSVNELVIQFMDGLQDLNGLDNLDQVGYINIAENNQLADFCGLQSAINNGFNGNWIVFENLYNPSLEEMMNGNCSQ